MTEQNLWTVFSAVAARVPERIAIVSRGRRISYGELAERARRLANVLTAHGLGHHVARDQLEPWEAGQDFAGLYMLNGPEYLEATLASYGARVAPANVNYRYVADELEYLLRDAGTGAIVYHARFAPTLAQVLGRLDRQPLLLQVDDGSGEAMLPGAVDYESALAAASGGSLAPVGGAHEPDDLYVLYTGGTTGMPKGTLWRQADIFMAALGGDALPADVDGIGAAAAARDANAILPIAPFMHGAAHWIALRAFFVGDTIVVNDIVDRLDPADVWSLVEAERVVAILMVGEAFARPLLDELERGAYDASSVSVVIVGGAVTSPETKSRIMSLLPGALVADSAGASETGGALSSVAANGVAGEAGIFLPGPTTAVLDADRTMVVPPGHDGIGWFAKSGHIPLGYLGDKDKTAATFPVVGGARWSVPGDRARLRADGAVELLGRDSVTINSGGEKIFAEEVEAAVLRHPDVVDAVVVGRPSERWGQEVVAVIAVRPGSDPSDDELLELCSARIARFKLPKAMIRVDTVVRSPAGKADYGWARRIASEHA